MWFLRVKYFAVFAEDLQEIYFISIASKEERSCKDCAAKVAARQADLQKSLRFT